MFPAPAFECLICSDHVGMSLMGLEVELRVNHGTDAVRWRVTSQGTKAGRSSYLLGSSLVVVKEKRMCLSSENHLRVSVV